MTGKNKNSLLNKTILTLGVFAAAAGQLCAQDREGKNSGQFLDNAEFDITVKSWHGDRKTPYNEWNPGLLVRYPLPYKGWKMAVGGFKNSNFDFSPITGVTYDYNLQKDPQKMQLNIGLVIGFAGYGKKKQNQMTMETLRIPKLDDMPKNEKHRGQMVEYAVDSAATARDSSSPFKTVTKFTKIYNPRSDKKMHPFGGALGMISFMENGIGPFGLFTYIPGTGLVTLFGLRVKPGDFKHP